MKTLSIIIALLLTASSGWAGVAKRYPPEKTLCPGKWTWYASEERWYCVEFMEIGGGYETEERIKLLEEIIKYLLEYKCQK